MTFIFTLVYNIKLLCMWVFIYSTSKQYQIFWITLYLDHRYPVGLAFISGSRPGGGARGQNLVRFQKVGFVC